MDEEYLKTVLIVSASILFIILIIFGVIKADEATKWNQGYCRECHIGKMQYREISPNGYIYECENCGKLIEIGEFK